MGSAGLLGGLTWAELGRRAWIEIYHSDILGRSAQLSYYFLLALFPLLLFLIALLGSFAEAGTKLRANLLAYLTALAPASASTLIYTTVDEISRNSGSGKLSFGLLASLWAASAGMGAIIDALNAAFDVTESRPWWKARLVALGLTITLAVLIISALALMLYGSDIARMVAGQFGYGDAFTRAWSVAQWPFVLGFVFISCGLIYYFAPNLPGRQWRWITPGAIIAVALWLLVSFGLRVYLYYFDSYSRTYGSLGAVIILMLWFYLTGAAVLIGGEVNSVIAKAQASRRKFQSPGSDPL
jgi:membrane protein